MAPDTTKQEARRVGWVLAAMLIRAAIALPGVLAREAWRRIRGGA